MVILRKKRLILTAYLIGISLFACIYSVANYEKNTISTVALPVSNKVVILDAGHGLPDEGATGMRGLSESSINLKITKKVQNLLEQSGCTVLLTRSDENGIYSSNSNTLREMKVSDMKNRVEIGNNSKADIFVSIHLNKIEQTQYWGWQTFFRKNDDKSEKLAVALQKGLNETIQKENKREALKIENKYLVDNVQIPIAIVECGFLSNVKEAELLSTEDYQTKLAWGIYVGIMNYFIE